MLCCDDRIGEVHYCTGRILNFCHPSWRELQSTGTCPPSQPRFRYSRYPIYNNIVQKESCSVPLSNPTVGQLFDQVLADGSNSNSETGVDWQPALYCRDLWLVQLSSIYKRYGGLRIAVI